MTSLASPVRKFHSKSETSPRESVWRRQTPIDSALRGGRRRQTDPTSPQTPWSPRCTPPTRTLMITSHSHHLTPHTLASHPQRWLSLSWVICTRIQPSDTSSPPPSPLPPPISRIFGKFAQWDLYLYLHQTPISRNFSIWCFCTEVCPEKVLGKAPNL